MVDPRNVLDKYKNMPTEGVKNDLSKSLLPSIIIMQNLKGELNFGNIVRTANNFNFEAVYYFGKRKWDRRSSICTHCYTNVNFIEAFEKLKELKSSFSFIGLENNIQKTIPIQNFDWPTKSAIIVGEEGTGISPEVFSLIDFFVEIPSLGSTRSINVSSAAAIAMYDYFIKFR